MEIENDEVKLCDDCGGEVNNEVGQLCGKCQECPMEDIVEQQLRVEEDNK